MSLLRRMWWIFLWQILRLFSWEKPTKNLPPKVHCVFHFQQPQISSLRTSGQLSRKQSELSPFPFVQTNTADFRCLGLPPSVVAGAGPGRADQGDRKTNDPGFGRLQHGDMQAYILFMTRSQDEVPREYYQALNSSRQLYVLSLNFLLILPLPIPLCLCLYMSGSHKWSVAKWGLSDASASVDFPAMLQQNHPPATVNQVAFCRFLLFFCVTPRFITPRFVVWQTLFDLVYRCWNQAWRLTVLLPQLFLNFSGKWKEGVSTQMVPPLK